ncbi:phenylacetic acid degradation protein [Catellatospora methionotrophica]|uniref:Phenylacetic acid degradation protein n=1 Tax=Catellatospora methionotrophica TaxID=121620 RepID=A0A8J3LCY6_9ACTN|nr:PaaI family thioesterase [Catellatospora methionotrophica]GIG16259.1 phenylacetic acid degradation protein [Catellatospora methionotrophica]
MTQTQTEPAAGPATPERTRTFSWSDPRRNAAELGQLSGLELLHAMGRGELPAPPVMHLLGMDSVQAELGRVVVTMRAQEFHYNPLGGVHGGILATLLDTAAACAVHSTLPAGIGYTSLDLNTKFLRPVSIDSGLLTCEGTVISRGRRTALAQAQLTDDRGRLLAHATSTCLIFDA